MTTLDPGGERRTAPRISFVGQAIVRAAGRHVPCTTVNLSSTGMLLLPSASAHAGLSMRVVFEVKDFLGPVDLEAVLAREADYRGHYGWGVRFVGMPQRVDALLQLYVRKRLLAVQAAPRTPPSGIEPMRRTSSGLYFQTKHRSGVSTPSTAHPHVLEATPDAGAPHEFAQAPTERDTTGGFVALDASPWPSDLAVTPAPTHQPIDPRPRDGQRPQSSGSYRQVFPRRSAGASASAGASTARPQRPRASDPLASSASPAAPPLTGLSAPGGVPKSGRPRRPGAKATPGAVGRSVQDKRMSRTGPPRRGAVQAMHQTGPGRPTVNKASPGKRQEQEWARQSHRTPLEVRELYQAALDEVSGSRRKRKRKDK